MIAETPIIAVCGKGGVGKTAISALLARAFIDDGLSPLLLIDADPAGGLVSAIGETIGTTLTDARERLIQASRRADDQERERLADQVDYYVLEALEERTHYSLLAMGHPRTKGCFCPANRLLREAIEFLTKSFSLVIIDAEAGIEQINREVTRTVTNLIVVTDGSSRSLQTLEHISAMLEHRPIATIANRSQANEFISSSPHLTFLGAIPEDDLLRDFDRQGRSLWNLPEDSGALRAMKKLKMKLVL